MICAAASIVFAALEALAISKNRRALEFVARPAVIVSLFAWLYLATGLGGAAFWFGAGLLFSLAGDLLLLWSERFFVHGLAAFLLTHSAYVIGFNMPRPAISLWSLILAVIVGLSAARLLRRLLTAVRERGQKRFTLPISIYGSVITLMLLSALLTLSNTDWSAGASLLVSFGAFAFYLSDVILAWNKFVAPISNGKLLNIGLYHAGQIALIAGVILQFS